MAKYRFLVNNNTVSTFEFEAESEEEAIQKMVDYKQTDAFKKEFLSHARLSTKFNVRCREVKVQPKSRATGKTYVEKFCEWHDALLPGTEYTNEDIRRAVGARTERAEYTMKYAPIVRDILLREQITWKSVGSIGHKVVYRKGKVAA